MTEAIRKLPLSFTRLAVSLPKTSIQLRPLDWQSPANQGMIVA
jgi:hypothetical protein